ncbi:4-hydroxythreonine-4-phosphate dehydrogenase PdxA [Pseudonocardia alaniniphila]|uniref:4-hydroxythreonine-4-phosphate dehydrogenase PdxA n=1 Tax=Pseudonocardia alaniniphila TaxID=75291 RepID=UPI00240275CE|nr:4-hydroxythreonine-4-phosphate dehydrogenase PdxA [Pseudonocardia alaniniphila]
MSRVLLSVGDPNGIGPEIAVKAAVALAGEPHLAPVLVADPYVVAPWVQQSELRLREIDAPAVPVADAVDVLAVEALPDGELLPGTVSAEAGAATVAYLRAAVGAVQARIGRAIVACPHSETAVNAAGIPFGGYPGLLGRPGVRAEGPRLPDAGRRWSADRARDPARAAGRRDRSTHS